MLVNLDNNHSLTSKILIINNFSLGALYKGLEINQHHLL